MGGGGQLGVVEWPVADPAAQSGGEAAESVQQGRRRRCCWSVWQVPFWQSASACAILRRAGDDKAVDDAKKKKEKYERGKQQPDQMD